MIYGNSIGTEIDRTFIIQDADGNELVATVTNKKVVFDATPNDIRIGKVAATQNGVTVGEKEIPVYYTWEGYKFIPNGSKFVLPTVDYDYTKIQAVFCAFNTNVSKSVAADKVAMYDSVYPVQSVTAMSSITKDHTNKRIDFGITNESGTMYLIRYIMYKEMY